MPLIPAHLIGTSNCNIKPNIDIYNGLDCCLTHEIFDNLKPEEPNCGPIYQFERALQGPVIEMTMRGFRVDPIAREKGIMELTTKLERLCYIIDKLASAVWSETIPKVKNPKYPKPERLNPESTKQLQEFFYGHLYLPPIVKYNNGQRSMPMDRDTLEKLETYFIARPIIMAILEYRDNVSQLEVLDSQIDNNWRMRTSYGIAATNSGRFSSSKNIYGTGRNMQNIEEGLRHIFIPDPGYKLYGIDLEQAESREMGLLIGLLFNDWSYLNACESGDLHTTVTRQVWPNMAWANDPVLNREIADRIFYREDSYRQASKVLGHGSNYYGKPPTMAIHTKIPVALVKAFQEIYFKTFPGIPAYHQWTAQTLQTKHQLTTVLGRTRDFFDRAKSDETLRSAISFLPQAGTADRLNLGMYKLWRYMPEAQLLAQLHDAVYFQVKEDIPETTVAKKALSLVEIHQTLPNGRKFVVPGEVKVGYNWGPRKENKQTGKVTNPNGLRKIKL